MIEATAKLKHARISVKKMRLVADMVRGKDVKKAESLLMVTDKKAAPMVLKTLKSAVANAADKKAVPAENLYIKKIIVNEGFGLKRWNAAAHGAAHPYTKHASHLEITVALKDGAPEPKAEAPKKKTVAKKDEKKVETKKTEVKKEVKPAAKKEAAKDKQEVKK